MLSVLKNADVSLELSQYCLPWSTSSKETGKFADVCISITSSPPCSGEFIIFTLSVLYFLLPHWTFCILFSPPSRTHYHLLKNKLSKLVWSYLAVYLSRLEWQQILSNCKLCITKKNKNKKRYVDQTNKTKKDASVTRPFENIVNFQPAKGPILADVQVLVAEVFPTMILQR